MVMANNKLNGMLLDCSYEVNQAGNAVIKVFVSDENGMKVFRDESFRPYFNVICKEPEKAIKAILAHEFPEKVKALSAEKVPKENAQGCVKVSFKNPQDLVKAREEIEGIEGVLEKREYDIPFANRYLIDKGLRPMAGIEIEEEGGSIKKIAAGEGLHKNRIISLDLETYSPGRFSDPKRDPILMCALSTPQWSKVYTYKKTGAKEGIVLKDEKELLEKALEEIRNLSPDILVTYNGDSFDLPYIKERCERLHVRCDFGFGGVRVVRKGVYNASELEGSQHLDAFQLVKFMARIGAVSLLKFDLESVSEKLFSKPKEKVKAEEINAHWDKGDIDRVVNYNREDAEVTLRLALEFLPLQLQLCSMLRQTLQETCRESSSQMVEQLLMIKSFELGFLVPNRPTEAQVNQRTLQTFEGGFVKEPVSGLHENIAVLDFRSLHPTIMISHNISLETLRCGHEECKSGANLSPDKDWFCTKKKGFLAGILEEILAERMKLKRAVKKMDKKSPDYQALNGRQHALKILLNSHYGYLGYPRSRWYSRESARAVTAWSRHYIRAVMHEAEEKGFKVLYGDTDSLFLQVPKEKVESDVRKFMESVNAGLPEAMELELDGFYRRGIFVTKESGGAAKKKYALIDFEGNLKIVGFEYVRRDWAPIAKNTQKKVIEAVLNEGRPEKAVQIAKEVIKELKSGKVAKKELVIMKQLKAKPENYDSLGPHVWAAKKAMQRGKEIGVGTIIGFVVTKGNSKKISDKAELEEYVKEGDYDADYYINHQILPAVLKITREFGYDKDDLMQGGKQSTLFGFK